MALLKNSFLKLFVAYGVSFLTYFPYYQTCAVKLGHLLFPDPGAGGTAGGPQQGTQGAG